MRVLVIGGTVFLGRAVVDEAVALGATVTVFNRGLSGESADGVEQLVGDRKVAADLDQLRDREFDVVVDTCGYVPADVAASASLVRTEHYAFVSTINVFPGWPSMADYHAGGLHEGDPDATAAPDGVEGSESYGWLKAGCELAVRRARGERASVLRAGCIVGPGDGTVGRLTWWNQRVARGGETLVPGAPSDPMTLIDARDLARFALSGVTGTFETTGLPSTRSALMTACRDATGSDASFTWVDGAWLGAQPVEPWTEIPLWAGPDEPGLFAHDPSAAIAAGMTLQPLAETVADTWAWQQRVGWESAPRTPGLAADKERDLLTAWHAR